MTAQRSPRAAVTTTTLPRFDRVALATLALGSTAAPLAGCHREPLCIEMHEHDPRSVLARLAAPVTCTTGPGETTGPVAGQSYGGAAVAVHETPPPPPPPPPPGAPPMVRPDPPPPPRRHVRPAGSPAAVRPGDTSSNGHPGPRGG